MTGFTADYIVQQMADFKSGVRKDAARMNAIAKDMSDEEIRQAGEWFARLKPMRVDEGDRGGDGAEDVRRPGPHALRAAGRRDGADRQPHHHRAARIRRRARLRDPHAGAGFIAYVPVGSIAKGKALVETGGSGKTIACSICHGDALKGLGTCRRLAGLHPIYIARQLYLFKDGTRNGVDAQLMKKPVGEADRRRHPGDLGVSGSLAP